MSDKKKVLIFIVAYNAQSFIEGVLDRIPAEVFDNPRYEHEILVIDDCSPDCTFDAARAYKDRLKDGGMRLTVMKNQVNLGYGGNQKLGYQYAVENGFDAVVLLHGDGQYAPEELPAMIAPILSGEADFVLGSRMLRKRGALKGGMPLYKFAGNIVLTWLQNRLLGSSLAEFHTGYRAYGVHALRRVPFQLNSNDFDFDTDILIQLLDNGFVCREIEMPTHYGDEVCHVNGMKYAFDILRTTLQSRIQRFGILYHPKFDYEEYTTYPPKIGFDSSHTWSLDRVEDKSTVLDIGCGSGHIARELVGRGCRVFGVDQYIDPGQKSLFTDCVEADLDTHVMDFGDERFDYVLLMDIMEHLAAPERFFLRLRESRSIQGSRIVITTGNVAFLPIRLRLLLGAFNYGKRGILDMTHKRLFTFRSFAAILRNCGYRIEELDGVPAPFPMVFGNGRFGRSLSWLNRKMIRVSKGMFSYQIAAVAVPQPTPGQLLETAEKY